MNSIGLKAVTKRLVLLYKFVISPILHTIAGPGHGCRFHPTCSQYFEEALESHGVFRGLFLSSRRIGRCHPWGGRGYDPVPERKDRSWIVEPCSQSD